MKKQRHAGAQDTCDSLGSRFSFIMSLTDGKCLGDSVYLFGACPERGKLQ